MYVMYIANYVLRELLQLQVSTYKANYYPACMHKG